MAISGSPKMLAGDIAKGVTSLTVSNIKQYTPADLKTIMVNIGIVQREIRGEQVPIDDVMAVKAKNQKLQRLNQAVSTISSYAKQRRIPL
jgi:hypothetical protein